MCGHAFLRGCVPAGWLCRELWGRFRRRGKAPVEGDVRLNFFEGVDMVDFVIVFFFVLVEFCYYIGNSG